MTSNNDLFVRPPLGFDIPNDGVTNVARPDDEKQWAVLKYELESFVCEGEYERGLEKIVSSYLRHRSGTTQPAVWVSGFYGSGKSHLVRVLEHLWTDTRLPDGASARGLAALPQSVLDPLTELSTVAKRDGAAAWAAAGSLDRGGQSLNAVVLAIVLRAAGLPARVAPAQVALWLAGQGILDAVRNHITQAGGDPAQELDEFNLSTLLAEAILAADPGYATSPAEVRKALRAQFPPETDSLSTDQTVGLLRRVLTFAGGGVIPPSLIVLDEVQQYVSGDGGKANEVQNLVEAVSRELDGRVLLVATGQQELTQDPTLAKIQDRFTVRVILKNQDVDAVVRNVLLRKEPSQRPALVRTLDSAAGEISRQLAGSKAQHAPADDKDLPEDYPLLPSRRRFWESVLRQADAGRAGQLRSQLRIVHDANRHVADRPVGTVVGADFLYAAKNEDLNAAGNLLKETQKLIDDEAAKDPLRGRVLGLIHLIGMIQSLQGPADLGIRPTQEHLAGLLVEDLAHDGARLRQELPVLLSDLVEEGVLQQDGNQYHLQTTAGRAWDTAFRRHFAQLGDSEVTAERDALLRAGVDKALPNQVPQGKAKETRKLSLHDDGNPPAVGSTVPVWLRSEWDDGTTSKQAQDAARGLGSESPVLVVHLARNQSAAFTTALKNMLAAQRVLDQQGIPQDDEGKQARRSMESRYQHASGQVEDHVRGILGGATVLLGGGRLLSGVTLRDRLEAGAKDAVTRLFPQFDDADDSRWDQVVKRVREGSGDTALKAVGWNGDAVQHPVVKEVLGRISNAGTAATQLEAVLAAPYGWPSDALKGAIGVLMAGGHVRATINGTDATADAVMRLTRLGTVHLRREASVLSAAEKLRARSILVGLEVTANADTLPADVETALAKLTARAQTLSGPAPLPQLTPPPVVAKVRQATGNERVHALIAAADEIKAFADDVDELASRRPQRVAQWELAQALARAAADLPSAESVRGRLSAFGEGRELLAEVDGITPILGDLVGTVREAVSAAHAELESVREKALADLAGQDAWRALDDAGRTGLLDRYHLGAEKAPDLGTPQAVLSVVQARPLASWSDARDALPTRAANALAEAVRLAVPRSVTVALPSATVRSAEDIEAYLGSLRDRLTRALSENETVVVKGS